MSEPAGLGATDAAAAEPPTGSIDDVKHVVVLMMENRSFDHYLGTLDGVRGFGDKQALRFPDGTDVFHQPDPTRADGAMLPFRLDTTRFNAQRAAGLAHDWQTMHQAINHSAMDGWIAAKGPFTMGYFTRDDIPYQYALSDAFTVCDTYFCSLAGPTDPNRLYLWSGTAGPASDKREPFIDNDIVTANPMADWTSYAERLQKAGVRWRVYHELGGQETGTGDYDCNALSYFKQFHGLSKKDPLHQNAMTPHPLEEFQADCANGQLPTVSWLVPPYLYCEHPDAGPAYGAHWVNAAVQAVMHGPAWKNTVLLVMYDENNGYFDHVVPPTPELRTKDEFAYGQPIGLGNRVPLWVISPWSRGRYVNSQVFDHTSVLRFLELVTKVEERNISSWRRTVCGDLTSCFDFSAPDYSLPTLCDTKKLMDLQDKQTHYQKVQLPALGEQSMPVQEQGPRRHRRLPYRPWADAVVDRATATVTCTFKNTGTMAFPFTVYPNIVDPFVGTPFTVEPGATRTYVWDGARTDGHYDFTVHGPDGFVRRFAGTVVRPDQKDIAVPSVTASPTERTPTITVHLDNEDGDREVAFTAIPNDHAGTAQTLWVAPRVSTSLEWPLDPEGFYDFTVTAGTGTRFLQRYAGCLH